LQAANSSSFSTARCNLEEEARDDSEIAATAADRPKQIRMLGLASGHDAEEDNVDQWASGRTRADSPTWIVGAI
jgi:hypothetical protein